MEKKFTDIINEGRELGAPVEAINAELKAAGATFHLNPDGSVSDWSEAEMAEGFTSSGEPAKEAQREFDMSRRPELAGTKQIQRIPGGVFEVNYDEGGYAKSAVRLHD